MTPEDRIEELESRLEETQIEMETQAHNYTVDKTRDLRIIGRLKAELGKGAGITDDEKLLKRLFDLWLSLRPSSGRKPAFSEDRVKALRWLVKHYEEDGAEKAIRASARFRYLVYGHWKETGAPEDRRDDLTDFGNNAKRTEELIALHDGEVLIPGPVASPQGPPEAAAAHRLTFGWSPLDRAVSALKREMGFDTASPEFAEKSLLDDQPRVLRWHTWCPKHPFAQVGLRLSEDGRGGHVHAECDGACFEGEILRAIFELEAKQVERAKALIAFEDVPSPATVDRLVKALGVRQSDSRYRVGRRMGIHDDEVLGLLADPREVFPT